MLHTSGHFRAPPPFWSSPTVVKIKGPAGVSARMVLEKPTAPPARSHNTNFFRAQGARLREDHTSFSRISWGFIGPSSPAASVEGARRSPCNAESCNLRPPGYSQAILAPLCSVRTQCRWGSSSRTTLLPYRPALLSSTCSLPVWRLLHPPQHLTPRAALAPSRPRLSLSSSPPNTAWPENPCLRSCQGDA